MDQNEAQEILLKKNLIEKAEALVRRTGAPKSTTYWPLDTTQTALQSLTTALPVGIAMVSNQVNIPFRSVQAVGDEGAFVWMLLDYGQGTGQTPMKMFANARYTDNILANCRAIWWPAQSGLSIQLIFNQFGKYESGKVSVTGAVTVSGTVDVDQVQNVVNVEEVENVTSVDTVDEVAHVTNVDSVDEVAHVTNVDDVDNVDEVANVTSVDNLDDLDNIQGGTTHSSAAVAMTSGTEKEIVAANAARSVTKPVVIQNQTGGDLWVGTGTITQTTAFLKYVNGEKFIYTNKAALRGNANATGDVTVWQEA